MTAAADLIRATQPEPIHLGMVLGSGLGGMADELEEATTFPFEDLPGFPLSTVTGHAGALTIGRLEGVPIAILSGRKHYYKPATPPRCASPWRHSRPWAPTSSS